MTVEVDFKTYLVIEKSVPFVAPKFGPLERTALIEAFKTISPRDLEIFALLNFGIRDTGQIARKAGFSDIEVHYLGDMPVERSSAMSKLKEEVEQKIIDFLVEATIFPKEPENTAWRNSRLLNYLMADLEDNVLGPRPEVRKAGRFSTMEELNINLKESQARDDKFVEWITNLHQKSTID